MQEKGMGKKQTINQKQSGMWPDCLKCIRVLYFSDFSPFSKRLSLFMTWST